MGENVNKYVDLAKHKSHGSQAYLIGTIAGIIVGALFVVCGFVLAVLGFSGSVDLVVQAKNIQTKLTNASPGVVFALLGMIVLWRYKPRTNETLEVNDTGLRQTTEMFRDDPNVSLPTGQRHAIGAKVEIPDRALRHVLAKQLGKTDEELGDLELKSLTGLDAKEQGIKNLVGLEMCQNLEILSLERNAVSDISALSKLKCLKVLSLNMNPLGDLTPLKSLPDLEMLFLGKCGLATSSDLATLNVTKTLSIVFNQISDLAPFLNAAFIRPGFVLMVFGNPLSENSIERVIPELKARGVDVKL